MTSLTSVSLLRDFPWVICLIRVSFGCVVASQFLVGLELFC
jgi:hypothetical protein